MKKILLTLALVGTVAGLVSCGGNNQASEQASSAETTTSSAETPASSSEVSSTVEGRNLDPNAYQVKDFDKTTPVTINFYSTMGDKLLAVFDEYMKDFKELYPNITVNHTQPGGYDAVRDQIKTELAAGASADIAYCYSDHVALYNKTHAVAKLDNLIADPIYGLSKAQKNDFIKGYYDEGKNFGDGKMYTLPFVKSTEVMYYNKEVFTKNNLAVPTTWFSTTYDASGNPTDTASMEYVCYKLKEFDPNCVPLGYDSESNWFITLSEQMKFPYTSATGDHFLFNNETAREVMYKLYTWKQKGYFTTQQIQGAYTSGLFVEQGKDAQKSYMSIGSSAGATHQVPTKVDGAYPFTVGIAQIPQADANNKKVISQGPSLCIFNYGDSQKVMASWLLMKFMTTTTEFQASFADASGYVPAIQSVKDNETYAAKLAKADQGNDFAAYLSAKVCLEQADNYFTSPAFIGSAEARDQVGQLLVACVNKNGGTDEATAKQFIATRFAEAITACSYSL